MMNLGTISIPTRYCGLPGKAHGGYCCGLLGKRIEGAAQVTLRAAPPLERPLRLESQEASGLRLWDDPRWTLQIRPNVDGANPAIGAGTQAGVL